MGRPITHGKKAVMDALVEANYNVSLMAKILGVSRSTAYSYLKTYRIEIKTTIFTKE